MSVSYKSLWKLLIEKDLKRKDLRNLTGLSTVYIAKLGKNQNVGVDVLEKICSALRCDISDIVEFIDEGEKLFEKRNTAES